MEYLSIVKSMSENLKAGTSVALHVTVNGGSQGFFTVGDVEGE